MKRNIFLFAMLAFCLASSAFAQDATAPIVRSENSLPLELRGYLVGPGDEIVGRVLGEKDFDFEATINENGLLEIPFFDQPVMAMCKNERELKDEILGALKKYLRSPRLSLKIERKSRPPAVVYGEVRNPQRYELTRRVKLLELISYSGGVTEKAAGTIQVVRTQPLVCSDEETANSLGEVVTNEMGVSMRTYNLANLREENPSIYAGDVILVQRASPVYIVGEVNAVGELPLGENGLALTEAIARVGGVKREAKTKNITIRRLQDGSRDREIISVNYDLIRKGSQKDVMLKAGDIIEVDKAKKSFADIMLEIATGGIKNIANTLPVMIL